MLDRRLQTKLNKEVGRCTSFTFVFWVKDFVVPVSAYNYLACFLQSLKVPSLVSPLHDHDVNETDVDTGEVEFKPGHYHVIIDFGNSNNKTINQCFEVIEPIRKFISIAPFDTLDVDDPEFLVKYPLVCKVWKNENVVRCMRTLVRYFKHLDNPEKYQYFDEDYHLFCGFELDDRILSTSDNLRVLDEIYDYIEENQVYSYWKFLRYCQYNNRVWYQAINKPQLSSQVINAIRSFTYDNSGALDHKVSEYRKELLSN